MHAEREEIPALEWANEFFDDVCAGDRRFKGRIHVFTTESVSETAKELEKSCETFYLKESRRDSIFSPKINPTVLTKLAPESIVEIKLSKSLSIPSISGVQMNYTRETSGDDRIPRLVSTSPWEKTPFDIKDEHERRLLYYCIKAMK